MESRCASGDHRVFKIFNVDLLECFFFFYFLFYIFLCISTSWEAWEIAFMIPRYLLKRHQVTGGTITRFYKLGGLLTAEFISYSTGGRGHPRSRQIWCLVRVCLLASWLILALSGCVSLGGSREYSSVFSSS